MGTVEEDYVENISPIRAGKNNLSQGMVDGSASKPALRQDSGYIVEKTYLDIAPYLGAFGAVFGGFFSAQQK